MDGIQILIELGKFGTLACLINAFVAVIASLVLSDERHKQTMLMAGAWSMLTLFFWFGLLITTIAVDIIVGSFT